MANGAITSNDLMQKLVNAKKLMNKVDSGDYERGNINEAAIMGGSGDENYGENYSENLNEYQEMPVDTSKMMSKGAPTADRISQSKLPDAIKKAMMENPIPQISLSETIDMDFVKGAKRLMEQEGVGKQQPQQRNTPRPQQQSTSSNIDMNAIAVLIENTVRKVMDEKLNQLLSAHTTSTINENLVLKVGDSIFRGKITGVNKSK